MLPWIYGTHPMPRVLACRRVQAVLAGGADPKDVLVRCADPTSTACMQARLGDVRVVGAGRVEGAAEVQAEGAGRRRGVGVVGYIGALVSRRSLSRAAGCLTRSCRGGREARV